MSPHTRIAFDEPHAFVPAPHGRLAYWRFGRGPDLVAVHGWPLWSATYRRLLPYLVDTFTVHLFDLPGAGRTEWTGPITFEANAAALRAAVDAVGLGRYGLYAHDSGGVVARLLAASDGRVAGLALSGSEVPGHRCALLQAYVLAARVAPAAKLLGAAMQIPAVRRSPLAFGTCFEDPAYTDGDFADLFVRPLRRASTARGQIALLGALDFDFIDRLAEVHGRIRATTLCVWGARDPFFPVHKARGMLSQFGGGAELVAIPGARLFPHEDHPAEVAGHAAPFLARCLATGEGRVQEAS